MIHLKSLFPFLSCIVAVSILMTGSLESTIWALQTEQDIDMARTSFRTVNPYCLPISVILRANVLFTPSAFIGSIFVDNIARRSSMVINPYK